MHQKDKPKLKSVSIYVSVGYVEVVIVHHFLLGTPYYLSPEICENKPYGRKSDVWSLGIILFELLALELPFQAQSLPALVIRIVSADPEYSKIDKYSSNINYWLKVMLDKKPESRPEVHDIVNRFTILSSALLFSYFLMIVSIIQRLFQKAYFTTSVSYNKARSWGS